MLDTQMELGMGTGVERDWFADIAPHIVDRFWIFHKANPHIYQLFKKFAYDLKRTGRQHYATKMILERIRWHFEVETRGDVFKINNNHAPCYARLLMRDEPFFRGLFQIRRTPGTVLPWEEDEEF